MEETNKTVQFECPICIETDKDPYILPTCGHSFCSECIKKSSGIRFTLICPICRVLCPDTNDIKKNYAFIQLKNRSLNKNSYENSLVVNRVEKQKEAPTLSDEFSNKKKIETKFLKSYYGAKIAQQLREETSKPSSFGIHIYRNGDRYEGDLVEGKKNGKGTYFYKNGDRYVGDWINDNQTGKGTYYWSQDEKYEGKLSNARKGFFFRKKFFFKLQKICGISSN